MKNQKKQNDAMNQNQPAYNTYEVDQDQNKNTNQNKNADQNKQDQNKTQNKQCK